MRGLREFLNVFEEEYLSPTPLRRLTGVAKAVERISCISAPQPATRAEAEPIEMFQSRIAWKFDEAGMAALPVRDFRRIPDGFWTGRKPLELHADLLDQYLLRLRASRLRSGMRRLAERYISAFPTHSPVLPKISEFLKEELGHFRSLPLARAQAAGLFSGEQDAVLIGKMLAGGDAQERLRNIGIEDRLWLAGGLVESGFRKACELFSTMPIDARADLYCLTSFARGEQGQFRYPSSKLAYLELMLRPWTHANPAESQQAAIERDLIALFGDPRVSPERWSDVPPPLTGVLVRWLTKGSIEQFLAIVDRSLEHDPHERKMWRYRRAFWMAYLDAGYITAAWVAFGRSALTAAKPTRSFEYGSLVDAQDARHSVLMLRIGDITIVEWSHNGRCWIWPRPGSQEAERASHAKSPQLFRRRYSASELRHAPYSFVHASPEAASWQQKVAGAIFKMTGRRVQTVDFMPK